MRRRVYGGIPSLPGQPRQLPHFPFSSRVCPMLLRFRVGSGQTEPPSVPLLRARRFTLYPSARAPLRFTLTPPLFRRLAPSCPRGTGQVVRGGCVCIYHARARARSHAPKPDRCLHPIPPPPSMVFSFSGFFAPYPPFGP